MGCRRMEPENGRKHQLPLILADTVCMKMAFSLTNHDGSNVQVFHHDHSSLIALGAS